MSYKLSLIKAQPNEMKFLTSYAYTIGAKLLVDDPESVGFVKEVNTNGVIEQYGLSYPIDEDVIPPGGVSVVPGLVAVQTEDDLDSKKAGIVDLYHWAQIFDANNYTKTELVEVGEFTEAWLKKVGDENE